MPLGLHISTELVDKMFDADVLVKAMLEAEDNLLFDRLPFPLSVSSSFITVCVLKSLHSEIASFLRSAWGMDVAIASNFLLQQTPNCPSPISSKFWFRKSTKHIT